MKCLCCSQNRTVVLTFSYNHLLFMYDEGLRTSRIISEMTHNSPICSGAILQ